MHGVCTGKLQVHAVEDVLLVTFRMDDLKLRRIEETARIQAIRRDEIAPLQASKGHIEATIIRAKAPIRSSHTSNRFCLAEAGTRRYLDYQARLVTKFGGRSAGDYFQRLNRIDRDLVGKDFASLIRHWLAIHRKGAFRMIADGVNQAVRVRHGPRRCQRHERADRGRRTFQWESVEQASVYVRVKGGFIFH